LLVNGFDLSAPQIRYGSDPHRFGARMEEAGLFQPGLPDPPARGARFVWLTFRIAIDRDMLERALSSFDLI
jgi:hypothetical protein